MTPELAGALYLLAILLCGLVANLNIFIMAKTYGWFDTNTSTEHKLAISTKSADNIHTQLTAEENRKAQEAARDAAKLVLQAEETRLERVRLEQKRDLR